MANQIKAPINYPVIAGGKIVAGGSVLFGQPNVKPDEDNPSTLKAVYLDAALTQPAQNPQGLSSDGVFDQSDTGILFGSNDTVYSIVIKGANKKELSYIPEYDLSDANAAATAQDAAAAAASSEANALSFKNLTEALYTDFTNRYFGPFSSDPSVDDLGNPPSEGSIYFNTTSDVFFTWNGSAWINYFPSNPNGLLVTATGTTTPRTLADLAEKEVLTYNSVSDARADLKLEVGRRVKTYGYYSPGDGGGAEYLVVLSSDGTHDGCNYINTTNGLKLYRPKSTTINLREAGGLVNGIDSDTNAIEAAVKYSDVVVIDGVSKHNSDIDIPIGKTVEFNLKKGRLQGFDIDGEAMFTGVMLEEDTGREVALNSDLTVPRPQGEVTDKVILREDLDSGGLQFWVAGLVSGRYILQRMFKGIGAGSSSDYDLLRCSQVYKSNECFTFSQSGVTVNGTNIPANITPLTIGDSGATIISEIHEMFGVAPTGEGFTIDMSSTEYTPKVSLIFRGTAGGPTVTITSGSYTKVVDLVDADYKYIVVDVPYSDSINIEKTAGGATAYFIGHSYSPIGNGNNPNGDMIYMSRLGSADTYVNNSGASDYAIRPDDTNLFAGSYHGHEIETSPTKVYVDGIEVSLSNNDFSVGNEIKTIQGTEILSTLNVTSEHLFFANGSVEKTFNFSGILKCNRAFFGMATFGKRFTDIIAPSGSSLAGLDELPLDGDSELYAISSTGSILMEDPLTGDKVYCDFPKYSSGSKVGNFGIKPTSDSLTGYNKPYGIRLYDCISDLGNESFTMFIQYI